MIRLSSRSDADDKLFCFSGYLLQLAGDDSKRFGEKSLYYVSL